MLISLSANTSWYLYNFRRSTIKALQAEGYSVLCISPEDAYSTKLQKELACTWLPLTMDNQGSNPVKDSFIFLQLLRYYYRYKPKVVLHFTIKNNVYGTWASSLLNIPAINNVSGLGTAFIHTGLVSTVVRLLYKLSFPLAFKVFCQNKEDYQLLINKKLVPQPKLIELPGSGVDVNRFSPVAKRQGALFRFLFAGRMLADKGLFELVAAMHQLNATNLCCELVLCGFLDVKNSTAISREQMQDWTSVSYISYIGSSDSMEEVIAQADCMVLPSYREGMPRSLLEAGSMAIPSVATNVAGCRNIIRDGQNGLLCEAQDVQSLYLAMLNMLKMSDTDRRSMGLNARGIVEQEFSEKKVVDLTLAAIKQGCESS